ncbi:Hypothetical protein SRAE_1000015500 [Strongyloides ratti]|uniref:Uncharacterized protein n=1 Tax=Strongyloides ratti TaxID=34506 RepID=A0A090L324_STRRB|nr:Hypothetical protein SRAE_1000015500 [Strongyloides ratti]CEF61879.1 Hypothetical protein SRAE_1000015500 [Strongyloides ratti]
MITRGFDSTTFNETDTNDDLTILNTSFEAELEGDIHFMTVNLKKLYSSRRISLFCFNVFSTILIQRFQRYKEYGKCVSMPNGQKIVITKFPTAISRHLTSHFLDMEKLLKEKKINGVSIVFYDDCAKKIIESYKFMIFVDTNEIKAFTDYNGKPIVYLPSVDTFESDKKLFSNIYEKVYNHCDRLISIQHAYVFPLFRFHFIKKQDRKEYEKILKDQPLSFRFAQKPLFSTNNDGVLLVANIRKRFTYGFVYNHI